MTNECIYCGRPLRTGRKYCYEHRSLGRYGGDNKEDDIQKIIKLGIFSLPFTLGIIGIFKGYIFLGVLSILFQILIIYLIIKYKPKKEESESNYSPLPHRKSRISRDFDRWLRSPVTSKRILK